MAEKMVVVISGTSKGIGQKTAEHFLNKGFIVYGCSRNEGTIQHSNYFHSQLDLKKESDICRWIRSIKKQVGRIDILFCNAGYAPANFLVTMTSGKILEDVMMTNIHGTFVMCREAAKLMMKQKSGRIITVSSMAAGLHLEGTSAYALSKSAIVEFTKILAKEMADFGVTCNCIAPSMYMTDGVDALQEKVIDRALNSLTLKRKLRIEEILHIIDFFCDKNAEAVTGQVIHLGLVN